MVAMHSDEFILILMCLSSEKLLSKIPWKLTLPTFLFNEQTPEENRGAKGDFKTKKMPALMSLHKMKLIGFYLALFLPIVQSSRNPMCGIPQKKFWIPDKSHRVKKKWKEQIEKERITNLKRELFFSMKNWFHNSNSLPSTSELSRNKSYLSGTFVVTWLSRRGSL